MVFIMGICRNYQYLRREELEVDVVFAVLAVCPTPYLLDSTNDQCEIIRSSYFTCAVLKPL